MSSAAIVIGVNRTGYLTPLQGAASGAAEFARWAKEQGMSVTLITDNNNHEVTLGEIQAAVGLASRLPDIQKLIVFFAGHGFLLSPQHELWLLSRAPDYDTEAVNVQTSLFNARFSGIGHAIFVSDACRSGGPSHQHRSVSGGSIFPQPRVYDYDGKIDAFYATRPGDVAFEYKTQADAVANHKGIFTECLLHALKGNEPEVVHEEQQGSQTRWLIPSYLLEAHLKTAVPERAGAISIKLNQTPLVIPESRLPQYFGELNHAPVAGPPRTSPEPPLDVGTFVSRVRDQAMSFDTTTDVVPRGAIADDLRQFASQMDRLASFRLDPENIETGFSVYGQIRSATVGDGLSVEVFVGDSARGVTHIRIDDPHDSGGRSVLIEFESGLGTVLAVKPGFIGTVLPEDNQVVHVSYTPSTLTPLFRDEYEPEAERIERRRSFAATATRHGVFWLDPEQAADAGDYLRMLKALDPTLGIYAVYAYIQGGHLAQVRSVISYMVNDPPPLPFDVALLSRFPEEFIRPETPVAPFCPMLRQGWAYLQLHPPAAEALRQFQSLLVPSLWTVFSPEGVARVRNALVEGVFR